MKTTVSTLTALVLALLLAVPALAGGDEQADLVTKTFTLTLDGEVPQDRVFGAFYYVSPDTHPAGLIQFCGPPVEGGEPPSQVVSATGCRGAGTVYTASVAFERGSGIFVEFVTLSVDDPQNTLEIFAESELLEPATTVAARYRFGAHNAPPLPGMPATGAGGTASTHPTPGRLAAVLSLLALGACALRRTARLGR